MVRRFFGFELPLFSPEDLQAIEAKIGEIEATTSGEIVVMSASRASSYASVHLVWAIGGWLVMTLSGIAANAVADWPLSLRAQALEQALGMLFGYCLPWIPAVKRRSLSSRRKALAVHREALAEFTASGIHGTKEHTGVLIFISELEHQVEILADRGIAAKVSADFWESEVREIIQGIRKREARKAILDSLSRIGSVLSANFPPSPENNPNELSNEVRRR